MMIFHLQHKVCDVIQGNGEILEMPNPKLRDTIKDQWKEKENSTYREQIDFWREVFEMDGYKVLGTAFVRILFFC